MTFLMHKGIVLKLKGKLYDVSVRSSMLYGSETWALRKGDELKLERNDMRMIRWICGTKLTNRIPSEELRGRLGLEDIRSVIRRRRLRWFGHVERSGESWIKKCTDFEVDGKRCKGRPRKSWGEVIAADLGLSRKDTLDRNRWRDGIHELSRRKIR